MIISLRFRGSFMLLTLLVGSTALRADSCFSGCSTTPVCAINCAPSSCVSSSISCTTSCDDKDDCKGSHSFFMPRSITNDPTFAFANNYHYLHHRIRSDDQCSWLSIIASPFYQKSRRGCDLAQYFFPRCQNSIKIAEDGSGDVNSLQVELVAPAPATNFFSSTLTMSPVRTTYGAYFTAQLDLSNYVDHVWANISFAAVHAKHDLHLSELNIVNPATGVAGISNAIQAFNNPRWCAGKLSPCALHRSGVDDIAIKVGYDWYWCAERDDLLSLYLIGTIPTGNRPKSVHVFEPIVGTKHGSVGFGVTGDVQLWQCEDQELRFMANFDYRYAFRATERRSFDLCANGEWSRYLQVAYRQFPSLSLPGINFFTQFVDVRPRSTIDLWAALHYSYCDLNFEAGYVFWWRQKESICLKCTDFSNDLAIYDMPGECPNRAPVSASTANISQSIVGTNRIVSDASFISLNNAALNLDSGAHPRAISHKVYGAVSYTPHICNSLPLIIGLGGSYEFARPRRNALTQWAFWGNLGVSF